MKELMRLTAVSLKNVYGISAMLYDTKKKKRTFKKVILFIAVIICLVPAYAMYVYFTSLMYDSYAMLNQTSAYLAQFLSLGAVVILIFGISYILSYFYMSKDLDTLLSLPIKPENIVLSKILTITVSEYMFVLPLMLPPIIKYGIAQSCNVVYYIESAVAIALLPVMVLGILAIIMIILMRGASLRIKKDKIQLITLFFTLAIVIAYQFLNVKFSSAMQYDNPAEVIAYYIQNSNAMLNNISKIFFPAVFASNAMINYNNISTVYYFLIYIFSCGVVVFVCSAVGRIFYIQSILKSSFSNKSTKINKKIDTNINSPMMSIFKNDIRLMLRTPIYLFNTVGVMIILPLMILIMSFASGVNKQIDLTALGQYKDLSILILAAAYTMFIGFTPILSTTFSREGQCFWITKTIPVTYNEQISARLLTHIILSVILVVACSISVFAVTKLNIFTLLAALLLGLIASMPTAYISLITDTKRPLLVWDNPQRAVKQNMNVIISMLICMAYLIILGVVGLFSAKLFGISAAIGVVFILCILLTVFFDRVTRKKFGNWFLKIEI